MRKLLILLAALVLSALAGLAALWFMAQGSRDAPEVGLNAARTGLRPCPPTPNCVCSHEVDSDAAIEPLVFACDPADAFLSLIEFLRGEERARVVTIGVDYVHAVYRTAVFGFEDDVELLLVPDAGVVHVRSASRVGHSDMGANRARVESIRARWVPPAPYGSELHDGFGDGLEPDEEE